MEKLNIGIIGTSQAVEGEEAYELAYETGCKVIEYNDRLVCGGKSGIMEAACKGATESANHSDGDIIGILPGHTKEWANTYLDIAIPTGQGHIRNTIVAHADALIAVGGGAGTLSEIALGWMYNRLLISFDIDGWSGQLAGKRIDHRTRDVQKPVEEDRIFSVTSPTEALDIIEEEIDSYRI